MISDSGRPTIIMDLHNERKGRQSDHAVLQTKGCHMLMNELHFVCAEISPGCQSWPKLSCTRSTKLCRFAACSYSPFGAHRLRQRQYGRSHEAVLRTLRRRSRQVMRSLQEHPLLHRRVPASRLVGTFARWLTLICIMLSTPQARTQIAMLHHTRRHTTTVTRSPPRHPPTGTWA